ncbi:MAG UNVERIFIED_CONTAM: BREX-1 system adenine-specific DNA-methyltransferase PglX [Planctomycetaceae bacterium]
MVAMFERLVALRMAEEKLDEATAVASVIRDNLFGLEIDPRCTQIAAFNLALAAWRRVGYCILPQMNLACSGLAPNTSREEWLALGGNNEQLRNGMERLFDLFEKAPVLGSLINPRADKTDLLAAGFHQLQPLVEQALSQEALAENSKIHTENYLEMAVTTRGLAKAAEILSGLFTLVATNVPYLGAASRKMSFRIIVNGSTKMRRRTLRHVLLNDVSNFVRALEQRFSFLHRIGSSWGRIRNCDSSCSIPQNGIWL